jgi:hypothetical protein
MAIGGHGYGLNDDNDDGIMPIMQLTRELNAIFAILNRRRLARRPDPTDAA